MSWFTVKERVFKCPQGHTIIETARFGRDQLHHVVRDGEVYTRISYDYCGTCYGEWMEKTFPIKEEVKA